jgi:type II secretory pathway predicted ATPase ExeA
MYESFFGFVKRPFLAVSTLDRYFPSTSVEQTCQTTTRAISRGEGPVAIFGGTGLGKTMCCMRVADNFRRNFEVVMLASSQLITRRALLQSLLFELRCPYREMSEGELRLTLMNRLQPSTENPTDGLVLIIDEAQTLSIKLLEELRLLTNVVRNGVPRVRMILCGTMRLEECLSHPHMESLNQRLAARCYLTPMSMPETGQYVKHKIELSGVNSSTIMTRDALEAIYRGSDGIPRLVDQLADQALLLACNDRERPVSAAMVGRAWCMLQQLPNPWSEPESIAKPEVTERFISQSSTTSVVPSSLPIPTNTLTNTPVFTKTIADASAASSGIEFGQLDEESDTAGVTGLFPQSGSLEGYQDNNPVVNESSYLVPESRQPIEPKKNLLDVFAGDFDEEFSIPVQSSASYNAYSGTAYGNLNHDLSSFGTKQAPIHAPVRFEVDDTEVFLPASQQGTNLAPTEALEEMYPDLVSNISPEQAANLERQIEEEMRELVSGLNMNAMTFDPLQAIANPSSAREHDFGRSGTTEQRLAHQAHTDVLSFSGLRERSQDDSEYGNSMYSNEEASFDRDALSDDRDLLVIEDDLETVRSGTHQATQASSKATLHPYAKLFTKLRSS